MKRTVVLSSIGGAEAIAHTAGFYLAISSLADQFQIVGASGVSGGAPVSAAMGLGIHPEVVASFVGELDATKVFSLAIQTPVAAPFDKFQGAFGFYQGAPYRRILEKGLGKTTFSDLAIPVEIPVFDYELGKLVVFSRAETPHVSLAGAARASGAIPLLFEPEKGLMGSEDTHHYCDPGLWCPVYTGVLDRVSFDHVVILVSDELILGPDENLSKNPWTFLHAGYRYICQALADELSEDIEEVREKVYRKASVQVISAPRNLHLMSFTSRDMTEALMASASVCKEALEKALE